MIDIQSTRNQTCWTSTDQFYDAQPLSFRKKRLTDKEICIQLHQQTTIRSININDNLLFVNITDLDLSFNLLTDFPSPLKNLPSLVHLNMSSNRLTHFPKALTNFRSLSGLNLSRNHISGPFPSELCQYLSQLRVLKLNENQITHIPTEFGQLSLLHTLILGSSTGGNLIEQLPSTVPFNNKSLRILDLSNNRLKDLPPNLGYHGSNLEQLSLHNNRISSLPRSIGHCNKLRLLDLSRNLLSYLPVELVDLDNLQSLDLSSNALCVIPADIASFMNKTSLLLTGNPMTRHKELGSIGDFSNHGHYAPAYSLESGMTSPINSYTPISTRQLMERLNSLQLESTEQDTPQFTSPPRTPPIQAQVPTLCPSLKELAARAVLALRIPVDAHLLPISVLRTLNNGARPCGYCSQPYVSEFLEGVELRYFQGHPSLPIKVTYCSSRCRDSSLPGTPIHSQSLPPLSSASTETNCSRAYSYTSSDTSSFYRSTLSQFGVMSSSPISTTPRSWRPQHQRPAKLSRAISSASSPLVPVKDLTMVDSLNDW